MGRNTIVSSSSHAPQPEAHHEPEPEHEPEHDETSQPPRRNNDQLYNTLRSLSARLADLQSCNCPADCLGPDAVYNFSGSSPNGPQTPRGASRCRKVKWRGQPRKQAEVLAEAWATTEIQLPRLGDTATGTLRMSVQVHTDPSRNSRRGVSNAFNFLTLLSVLLGEPSGFRVRAWVIGFLAIVLANAPTIVSYPQAAERLT